MEYNVKILRVLDGDTVDVLFKFPFGIQVKKRVRLFGINAPETRTRDPEEKRKGFLAKNRLMQLLEEGQNKCILVYHGDGKFGRPLGELFVDGVNINLVLVSEGHSVPYFGGKR